MSRACRVSLKVPSTITIDTIVLKSVIGTKTELILPALTSGIKEVIYVGKILVITIVTVKILTMSESLTMAITIILVCNYCNNVVKDFPSLADSVFKVGRAKRGCKFIVFNVMFTAFNTPTVSNLIDDGNCRVGIMFKVKTIFTIVTFMYLALLKRGLIGRRTRGSTKMGGSATRMDGPRTRWI